MTSNSRIWTVEEAADVAGIDPALAYSLIHVGLFPALRLGTRLVVPKAALMSMLKDPETAFPTDDDFPWLAEAIAS